MLVYCDYIADKLKTFLRNDSYEVDSFINFVDRVEMDLHPEEGYMLSTKKTFRVQDKGGRYYKVTVEEA
jgi:hypothetical protein